MIHPFCSALQARRRPVPVNTSSRRTGSGLDLGKSSVSDTCLTRSIQRADIRPSAPDVKRGVRRPLTMKEELGLDHFEGRSWQGLHRHALMTMIAYALPS